MKLRSIRLKNINSHKDTFYEFKKEDDIYLILGKNGAGKTIFIGSVPLALFGDDPYYGNLYDCVRLGSEKEGSEIEIVFLLGELEYRILRKIKVTKSTKSTESYLYRQEELVAGPKVKEFDNAIENLLSTKKVFLSSVFTSQNIAEDITEMPVSERTELLNKLWDLTFLQTLSDKAKEKVKNLNSTIFDKKQEIEKLEEIVSNEDFFEDTLASTKNTMIKLEEDRDQNEHELSILKEKVKQTENIDEKKKEYNDLLSQYTTNNSKITSLETENATKITSVNKEEELKTRLSSLEGLDDKLVDLEKQKEDLSQYINSKSSLDGKLKNSEYMLTSLSNEIVEVPCDEQSCPYFTEMHTRKEKKATLEKEIAIIKNDINLLEEKNSVIKHNSASEIQSRISELRQQVSEKNSILTELNSISFIKESIEKNTIQLNECVELKTQLQIKLQDLDTLIKEILSNIDDTLGTKIENIEKELNSIKIKYEDSLRIEGKYESSLEELGFKKVELNQLIKEVEVIKKELEYYTIIKEDFSKKGIQSMVINKLKNELEKVIKDLLSKLGNNTFDIKLSTTKELSSGEEKESLEILVSDQMGVRDVSKFSGGEKKLIKLVIRLSLSIYQSIKNKVKYDVFILDEATDALDAERKLGFIEIINSLKDYFKQIIVVTHSDELMGYFPTKLEFVKEGYTKIK